MQQYIGVRVAGEPPVMRDIQSAYDQRPVAGKCVNIKTMADSNHLCSPSLLMIDSAITTSSRVVFLILLYDDSTICTFSLSSSTILESSVTESAFVRAFSCACIISS